MVPRSSITIPTWGRNLNEKQYAGGVKYNAPMGNPRQISRFFHKVLTLFGWTRSSSVLLGGFFLICGLIAYVWWPLAQEAMAYIDWRGPWWLSMDWLLLGIFGFMSLTIIARASLGRDALIVFVGMVGGLVIEAWGTQTNLWHYFTAERPPLWIIPAWPIASLSIDRITRILNWGVKGLLTSRAKSCKEGSASLGLNSALPVFKVLYWAIFIGFFGLMLYFVAPTFGKSYTIMALLLVAVLTLTPTDHRYAVLTFAGRDRIGVLPGIMGNHASMLDVLHFPDSTAICGAGTWNGSCSVLASRDHGQTDMGKTSRMDPLQKNYFQA